MTALYIVLAVLGGLLLLLMIPVWLRVTYEEELRIRIRVLAVPVTLYPSRKKKAGKRLRKAKKVKKAKQPADRKKKGGFSELASMLKEDGVGAAVSYLTGIAALAKTAAGRILRAIVVDELALHLTIGGEDAAQTAIRYGKLCGAVFPALALLEGSMRVRRRDVRLSPDFVNGKGGAVLNLRLHAAPLRLLCALVGFIGGFIGNTVKEKALSS